MSTTYPKGSTGEQEQKNTKIFMEIAIPAAILFHALAFGIPQHAGLYFRAHWFCWLAIFAAGTAVTVCIRGRAKELDAFEESNVPYIIMILINFTSAVIIGAGAYITDNPS